MIGALRAEQALDTTESLAQALSNSRLLALSKESTFSHVACSGRGQLDSLWHTNVSSSSPT